jgi:hypothetical protein
LPFVVVFRRTVFRHIVPVHQRVPSALTLSRKQLVKEPDGMPVSFAIENQHHNKTVNGAWKNRFFLVVPMFTIVNPYPRSVDSAAFRHKQVAQL